MKNKMGSLVIIGLLICFSACKKEDDLSKPLLGLEGDTWEKTTLDTWLYNNFVKPYNIEVKYRWDATENAVNYTLVPPDIDKVQPIMEVVKQAWIDVYEAEAGAPFIKKYCPKQYMLIGSLRYNTGSVTLGEAEGGSKVTLFDVNQFNKHDRTMLKRVLKTIHHEFTHILNQTVPLPDNFRTLTKGLYTASWNQTSVAAARELGFISSYAMADAREDFAEMVAIMITEGRAGYNAIVNGVISASGKAIIRQKEEIVVTYMKQIWNIDLYNLMDRVNVVIETLAPTPLNTLFGFGKTYTSLLASPATIAGLSADFQTAYTTAKNNLFTNAAGRTLDEVYLQFTKADSVSLRVRYINSANAAFLAFFAYGAAFDADGNVTLTFKGNLTNTNTNSNTVGPYLTALTSYFNARFKMDWVNGPLANPLYGGLYKTTNTASSFNGVLGN